MKTIISLLSALITIGLMSCDNVPQEKEQKKNTVKIYKPKAQKPQIDSLNIRTKKLTYKELLQGLENDSTQKRFLQLQLNCSNEKELMQKLLNDSTHKRFLWISQRDLSTKAKCMWKVLNESKPKCLDKLKSNNNPKANEYKRKMKSRMKPRIK